MSENSYTCSVCEETSSLEQMRFFNWRINYEDTVIVCELCREDIEDE